MLHFIMNKYYKGILFLVLDILIDIDLIHFIMTIKKRRICFNESDKSQSYWLKDLMDREMLRR